MPFIASEAGLTELGPTSNKFPVIKGDSPIVDALKDDSNDRAERALEVDLGRLRLTSLVLRDSGWRH